MIYTASLALPVADALGSKKVMQSNLNKICELIKLDPTVSNMDVVIFGPKDLMGPKAERVRIAMKNVHADVCVIYLYTKDSEAGLLDVSNKKHVKKINKVAVKDAVDEFVGAHMIRQGKQQVSSADFMPNPDVDPAGLSEKSQGESPIVLPKKKPLFGGFGKKTPNNQRQEVFPGMPGQSSELLPVQEDLSEGLPDFDENFSNQDGVGQQGTPAMDIPDIPAPTMQPQPLDSDPTMSAPLSLEGLDLSTGNSEGQGFTVTPDTPQGETAVSGFMTPVTPIPETAPVPESAPLSIEESLANVNNYEDWALVKERLNRDSIVNMLIHENSEFKGLKQMIDVLDVRIETVWRDTALSPEQKFEKIKEIGLEKSTIRATSNSMESQKVIDIITKVVLSAKRTVEEKIQSVDSSLYKIASDKARFSDMTYVDQVIEERTKVQMELLAIARDIVDLYTSVDTLVTTEIKELDSQLPSASAFINNMVEPIGTQVFTPTNTAVLTNKLMKALQENRIVASSIEESVNAVINKLFELCECDEEVIHYLQNSVNLLKANRVEDAVIVDTLLKNILRIYVGADNTGRSATAITWCGILSRRQNSLLIDLTGRAKFKEYGIKSVRLDDFLSQRMEQQFLCVESDHILGPDELQSLIEELKLRLNYYPYVNVILAPEDENGLSQLSEEAMCVHYITDCSTSSMNTMREVIDKHNTQNVARKLVTIDPPVSPLMISDSLNVDPTIVKVITLPSVPAIRACSLRHDRPYEFTDVVKIFEEAFR